MFILQAKRDSPFLKETKVRQKGGEKGVYQKNVAKKKERPSVLHDCKAEDL